jgi:spore coat protein A
LETRSGQGLLVEWVNELPEKHLLPIDHSIHGAESSKPDVRSVVHLHGAKAPAHSDGYPEDWYLPGKSAICHYPNAQDATMLWYHDHTLGINRLNVFAGLFGGFLIRDEFEDALNLPRGKHEIPLMLCDRILDPEGQLNYPVSDDPKSPWVPEVFGDAVLINGKLFPYLEVEPRKYRFRVLNAANGRFFRLTLSSGQVFQQIGTDQGFLPAPVPLTRLVVAPGERADVVIDFSGSGGASILLKNDTFLNLMQFRVARTPVTDESTLPANLKPVPRIPESSAAKTRQLALGQIVDSVNRPVTMLLNNTHWSMPVTENPVLGSTEIWSFVNPTDDSHPIHLHLVKFQILDRRPIVTSIHWEPGEFRFTGPAVPPGPGESGWKDTVRADPSMVTRIIVPFEGFTGRYVWHCHVLEHEDNEMMRPFDVIAP